VSIIASSWQFRHLVAALGDSFNMTETTYSGRPLGYEVADLIAIGILVQSQAGKAPNGQAWKALTAKYLAWKISKGYDTRRNFMTGRMLDYLQIRGTVMLMKDGMTMRYGLTSFEQLKAEWTSEGTRHNKRPARPFYDLSKDTCDSLDIFLDKHLDWYIVSLGARRI
jgi:hypothetical protein